MAFLERFQDDNLALYGSMSVRMVFTRVASRIAVLTALMISIGCAGVTPPAQAPSSSGTVDQTVSPSEVGPLWSDIQPIIQNRCTPCHLPGGYMFGVTPLDTYLNVVGKKTRIRTLVSVTRTMPFQREMPDAERELIAQWIDAGLPY